MAKNLKPFGISVDYNLGDAPADDHVVVKLFRRVDDGDNEVVDTRTYRPTEWDATIQRRVLLYGASKLVQDRTSDESGEDTRLSAMDDVVTRFVAGQWEKEREATGPTVRIEVEALAAIKGVGVAAIQKALRSLDAETREKVLTSEAVKAKAQEIRAEREGQADIDLSDLA